MAVLPFYFVPRCAAEAAAAREQGQCECGGLARAGRRQAEQVLTAQKRRDGLDLDRGGGGIARLGARTQQRREQPQGLKARKAHGDRCSRGAESACRLSVMAASTSRHFPESCAAASSFSRARSSRRLGATLIWAIAAIGLPARSSAMILTGQEDELLTEFF